MINKVSAALKYGAAGLAAVIAVTASLAAAAAPSSRAAWPAFTVVAEKSKEGPPGWAEFCRNYKTECVVQASEPRKVALTTEIWSKLVEVNRLANATIKPLEDRKHWGRINKWYFADDGKGDCKDYVLVKRRMLTGSGLPREALLITIVWTPQQKGHAVLIVRTDKGDYVLDSLTPKIVLWNQTPYDYVMRQSQSNPNAWLFIDGDPLKPPAIADKTIAENPADEPAVMVSVLNRGTGKQEAVASRQDAVAVPGADTTSGAAIVPDVARESAGESPR